MSTSSMMPLNARLFLMNVSASESDMQLLLNELKESDADLETL